MSMRRPLVHCLSNHACTYETTYLIMPRHRILQQLLTDLQDFANKNTRCLNKFYPNTCEYICPKYYFGYKYTKILIVVHLKSKFNQCHVFYLATLFTEHLVFTMPDALL